jgi:hypothetical protein
MDAPNTLQDTMIYSKLRETKIQMVLQGSLKENLTPSSCRKYRPPRTRTITSFFTKLKK